MTTMHSFLPQQKHQKSKNDHFKKAMKTDGVSNGNLMQHGFVKYIPRKDLLGGVLISSSLLSAATLKY